jgi:hypothetical protein
MKSFLPHKGSILVLGASGTRAATCGFRRSRTGSDDRVHVSQGESEMAPD